MLAPRTNRYRFGEFTFDPASGELRRNGNTVRLQPQPVQVLLALLCHPGQVVTREEFRSSLWTADTNVEFDDGLNHAIRRLRDALSDTAQVPLYIETIPRRGYRFVPPVDVESPPSSAGPPGAAFSASVWRRSLWSALIVACAAIAVVTSVVLIHRRSAAPIGSLAVLPLANFSGDSDQDYFADGITEELTTELARVKTLRVISRTSAMRLKGTKLSLKEIGRELGVDAVVEGSVQRSGSRVRISAQLVQIASERHLWAETYERELRDVLQVRSEVARDIAARVRLEVAPESARLAQNSIPAEAYDAFLMGTRLSSRGDNEGFEESIRYFEQAIRLDPDFALAYAELAESHGMLAFLADERGDHFKKANLAANKAFKLDPTLPEGQIGTADLLFYWEWDWAQCEGAFREAAEKYPNSAHVQYHYGLCLFVLSRYDEALRYLERARRVDPLSPMINRVIGWLLYVMGRKQEAIEQLLRARELEPGDRTTYSLLSRAYDRAGQESESVSAYITSRKLAGDPEAETDALGRAYRSRGQEAFNHERRKILKSKLHDVLTKKSSEPARALTIASLCASIGNADLAFQYLDKAYAERSPTLTWIKSGIQWEPLHEDPRFHAFVRRMGLPD